MDEIDKQINAILTAAFKEMIVATTHEEAKSLGDSAVAKIRAIVFDGSRVLDEIYKLRAEVHSLKDDVVSLRRGLNSLDGRTLGSQMIGMPPRSTLDSLRSRRKPAPGSES